MWLFWLFLAVLALACVVLVVGGYVYRRHLCRESFLEAAIMLNQMCKHDPHKGIIEILMTVPQARHKHYEKRLARLMEDRSKLHTLPDSRDSADPKGGRDPLKLRPGVNLVSHGQILDIMLAGNMDSQKTVLFVVEIDALERTLHHLGELVDNLMQSARGLSVVGQFNRGLLRDILGCNAQYRLLVLILEEMVSNAGGDPYKLLVDKVADGEARDRLADLNRDTKVRLTRVYNAVLALWKGGDGGVFLRRSDGSTISENLETELLGLFLRVQRTHKYEAIQNQWRNAGAEQRRFCGDGMRGRFRAMATFILRNGSGTPVKARDHIPDRTSLLGFSMIDNAGVGRVDAFSGERYYAERIAMEIPGLSERQIIMSALSPTPYPVSSADIFLFARSIVVVSGTLDGPISVDVIDPRTGHMETIDMGMNSAHILASRIPVPRY